MNLSKTKQNPKNPKTFAGYKIEEILSVCHKIVCPECKSETFELYVSPKGSNFLVRCGCGRFLEWSEIAKQAPILSTSDNNTIVEDKKQ